jgi:signal transduction histidine kinase
MDAATFLIGAAVGLAAAVPLALLEGRRRERRVRAAETRARRAERLAEVGAMTRGLAHEIKNPLSTIGLNAQLLEEGIAELDADPEHRGRLVRRVGTLRREADRLGEILGDFLRFAGEIRLSREPIDLNTVVDELADFYAPQAQHHGVRLRVELAPDPLVAELDADHLKQALLNLMINATQAMTASAAANPDSAAASDRGDLMLRTAPAQMPEGGPAVAVHVTDTGPGMTEETRRKAFEPYFTTKGGGSGLGLPTTKRLVEEHGGTLAIHSEPGRGTEFTVLIPAESASSA